MRNYSQNNSLSKINSISRNNTRLENSCNNSNVLTANHFFLKKRMNETMSSRKKNKETNSSNNNEIIKELKKINDFKFIVHNKILNNKGIKLKPKKVKSEIELFQDYYLESFKYPNNNYKRNVIEKLGACVEKKYNIIRNRKNNNNSRSNRIKGMLSLKKKNIPNTIQEYNKNSSTISSKRLKHSYSTSHFMDAKSQDSLPILMNSPLNLEKKFNSLSEKERDDKNIAALIKLKHILSMHWKERKDIVKEFFEKNNIYEDYFYKDKHLYNFANFINYNIFNDKKGTKCYIETRYPMNEIILKGIKYKPKFDETKTEINTINNKKEIKRIPRASTTIDVFNRRKELTDFFEGRDKVNKYRSYLDKNYKTYIMNKMLKGLTKDEKTIYFSDKKYGIINIADQKNIVNNIQKQAFYQKIYDLQTKENLTKKSIKYFNNDDLKKLNEELKVAHDSIFKKSIDEKVLRQKEEKIGIKFSKINNKAINKLNQRLYYTIKINYLKNNPDIIPKKKLKLLEYVIANKIKERKAFEDKFKQYFN